MQLCHTLAIRFNLVTHLLFEKDNRPLIVAHFVTILYVEKHGHDLTVKIICGSQSVTQLRFTSHNPFSCV